MNCVKVAVLLAGTVASLLSDSSSWAVEINYGNVFVAASDFRTYILTGDLDAMQPALWKVNPLTGIREIVTSKTRGVGPELRSVTAVVVDDQRRITISDPYGHAIFQVDPATGDRTPLYDGSSPESDGPFLHSIGRLALGQDNSIYVGDFLDEKIVRIDPTTGIRTLISGAGRGTGSNWRYSHLVVADSGDLWTTVYQAGETGYGLVHIDADTGDRTLVSGFGVGGGASSVLDAQGLSLLNSQTAVVLDGATITHINLNTGHRTNYGKFIHPVIAAPNGIGGNASTGFFVAGEHADSLYRLDLATLNASLITGPASPEGPNMLQPLDVFVFVPEPSTRIMAFTIGACVALVQVRRVNRLKR